MKKTFEDRQRLIDRLERKYARKVRMYSQNKQHGIKSAFRQMRGKQLDFEDLYSSPAEEFFHRNPTIA